MSWASLSFFVQWAPQLQPTVSLMIHGDEAHKSSNTGPKAENHLLRSKPHEDRGQDGSDMATARKHPEPSEARRDKEGSTP